MRSAGTRGQGNIKPAIDEDDGRGPASQVDALNDDVQEHPVRQVRFANLNEIHASVDGGRDLIE
jgi:hypothetical protein